MVKDTALTAIKMGSSAETIGELAKVADEIPNKEATGLAQTPMQAPLLQHDNKIGAAEVNPPVRVVQIDFFESIIILLKWMDNIYFLTKKRVLLRLLMRVLLLKDQSHQQRLVRY
jgi:hypothetical protein